MSIYDDLHSPQAVISPDQGVMQYVQPPITFTGNPLPLEPTDSPVPLAARITNDEATRLSQGRDGRVFFHRMLSSVILHP
jgi:hypothetical protein